MNVLGIIRITIGATVLALAILCAAHYSERPLQYESP